MVEYDLDDWDLVTEIAQLSDGEQYFVCSKGEVLGVLSFDGDYLSNDYAIIDLSGDIPEDLWIMEFNWPLPPKG